MPLPHLTPSRAKVLSFLESHIATRGYAPTMREICEALGWTSTNGVTQHLRALERDGYIRVTPMIARGLVVLHGTSGAIVDTSKHTAKVRVAT